MFDHVLDDVAAEVRVAGVGPADDLVSGRARGLVDDVGLSLVGRAAPGERAACRQQHFTPPSIKPPFITMYSMCG